MSLRAPDQKELPAMRAHRRSARNSNIGSNSNTIFWPCPLLTFDFVAAFHPLCFVRPLVAFQWLARYLTSAAPDPAGTAGHPGRLPFSRLDQRFCSRQRCCQPQPCQLQPARCQSDPQGHSHHQPYHRNDHDQPSLVNLARDDADCSTSLVKSPEVLGRKKGAGLRVLFSLGPSGTYLCTSPEFKFCIIARVPLIAGLNNFSSLHFCPS